MSLLVRGIRTFVPSARSRFASSTAASFKTHGRPETVLSVGASELPSVGANDVRVRMIAAPINPADLNIVEGVYPVLPKLPAVGGTEGVGVVEEVGSSVKGLAKGDKVIPAAFGVGTWCSEAVAPADGFSKISADIKDEYAACLGTNPCSAYRMLNDFASLSSGDVLIQNGANSAVGVAVIQMAKAKGVKTINIVRSRTDHDDTIEQLKDLGADIVVTDQYARSAEMRELVSDIPKPKLALNCTGGAMATEVARLLGDGGVLVTYGGMSRKPVTVPTAHLIFRDITMRGFWLTQWLENHSAAERQQMVDEVSGMVRDNKLKMLIERVPFADFDSAVARAQQGFRGRKVVMTM